MIVIPITNGAHEKMLVTRRQDLFYLQDFKYVAIGKSLENVYELQLKQADYISNDIIKNVIKKEIGNNPNIVTNYVVAPHTTKQNIGKIKDMVKIPRFFNEPRKNKKARHVSFLDEHEKYMRPIVVNAEGYMLMDGYITYQLATELPHKQTTVDIVLL